MNNLSGHRDFSGEDRRGQDFSAANLRRADFSNANLRNADFSGAEIQGANFQNANLCEANFTHVSTDAASSLPEVNFSNAKIKGAKFTDARLNHANFTGVQAGLTRFWSFILYSVHIFLCLISAFTTTISITFLIYFFRASSKKPSFLSSIFIGIISVFIIVVLRTLLLNFFRPLLFPSVVLGIIAIVIVLIVAFVTTTINEEEDFSSSIMTGLLLFLILMITINSTMFADYEDSLPRELGYFVHNLGSKTTNNPNDTNGAWISMVLASTIGAIFGCWFSRSAITQNTQFDWLWKLYIKIATHGGTLFNEADLTDATFTSATLKGANFKNAIITRTRWKEVKSLEHARVGNSYLKYPKVRQLFMKRRLKNKNFDNLNLEGINLERENLSDASFVSTNLKLSTLEGSNLELANLQQAKLDSANLSHTCLTGACLQDWTIDERTILSDIECEYIFLEELSNHFMGRRRFPPSSNNFRPGDFEKFFRKDSSVLQLLIRSEDNRQALTVAFQQLIEGNDYQLQGFEMIGDDALVKIKVTDGADTSTVESKFYQTYKTELNEPNPEHKQDTGLDEQSSIEKVILKAFEMADKMSHTVNINGNVNHFGDNNGDSSVTNVQGENNIINMNQDLTQAASQIEELLNQKLQKQDVTDDAAAQKEVADEMAKLAKADPKIKDKLKKWGQSLGEATVSDVVKDVVKGTVLLAIKSAGIPLPYV
jgi:uncharacterized protein YjbI with pentapeptide repeats